MFASRLGASSSLSASPKVRCSAPWSGGMRGFGIRDIGRISERAGHIGGASHEGEERSLPSLRDAVVGQVAEEWVDLIVVAEAFDEQACCGNAGSGIGVLDQAFQEGCDVLHHDDGWMQRLSDGCDWQHEQVSGLSGSGLRVVFRAPVVARCAHALAGRAGGEQRGGAATGDGLPLLHHLGPSRRQIAANALGIGVVSEGDIESRLDEFGHDAKTEARSRET